MWGGYGAAHLLPYLDFESIADNPKPFVGYSDITALHTPWKFDVDGCIWFFEDVDSPPWYIDGMLWQLTQAGKLDGVAGVVVGEMDKCDWREDRRRGIADEIPGGCARDASGTFAGARAIQASARARQAPGHAAPGVTATLDADARTLTINERSLRPAA